MNGYNYLKALTFKQYRIIDLSLLGLLFVIGEAVVTTAAQSWFPGEAYSFSVAIVFFCLGYMRWSAWAAFYPLIGGVTFCLTMALTENKAVSGEQFAIYCLGSMLSLAAILLFKVLGKEKIRTKTMYTILYVICVYLMTEIGRFCVSFIFERNINLFPTFLAVDSMSGVFALVVILAIRKIDGMFEDQKAYLFRLEREKEKDKVKEDEFGNRV